MVAEFSNSYSTKNPTMTIATINETINWCPPIHRKLTDSTDPSNVTLSPDLVVLVLGSSRGIGLATAICYAKAGASNIILTGRTKGTLESASRDVHAAAEKAGKIEKGKLTVESVVCDVTSESNLKALAKEIEGKFNGRLDVVILNAGKANGLIKAPDGLMDWPHSIPSLDIPDFRLVFETNFFSGVIALKFLIPLLEAAPAESPKAVVWVTTSTVHAVDPKTMAMGYALSKYAASRFVEYVHHAHGDNGKGVTAFGIQPGSVMTDMGKYELPEGKGWEKSTSISPCSFFDVGVGRS